MFDIGFWEMAFIGVIALIVIGPERLPGLARNVGLWVGKGRRLLNEVKSDVKREMKEYDVDQVRALKEEFESANQGLKNISKSNSDPLGLKETSDDIKEVVGGNYESLVKSANEGNSAGKKKTANKKKVVTSKPITKKATIKKAATKKATQKTLVKSESRKPPVKKVPIKKATGARKTAKPAPGKEQ